MTEQELRDLIAGGETLTVEFKSDSPDRDGLSDHDMQEAVVCLANQDGGQLLIGVENSGRVTGLHPKHAQSTPGSLASALRNLLMGSMPPDVACEFVPTLDGLVAVVQVSRARAPVATSRTVVLRRGIGPDGKPQCIGIGPDELTALRATRGLYDHSARPLPELNFDALSRAELDRVRGFIRQQPQATKSLAELGDLDLAVSLKLVVRQEGRAVPTVLGLLLTGRQEVLEEYVPAHSIGFQDLDPSRDVTANEFYPEPLLRIWERFESFFQARNPQREVSLGLNLQRTAIPRYPERAVREAFANALVHRDYTLLGAVLFQFADRNGDLKISSPGGFVDGVSTQTILTGGSVPRNAHLAEAFRHLGLVERSGRGIPRIFEDVLSLGRPAPTYRATIRKVDVTIPGGEADAKFVEMVVRAQDRHQRMDWAHLLVLHRLSRIELSLADIAHLTDRSDEDARALVTEMQDWGLIEAKGSRSQRSYQLSAAVYRQLKQPAEYVRRKGFESEQREQMVLSYVRAHGKITRAEAAELCQATPPQAEYLLRKLSKQGKLSHVIAAKYSYYTLPPL